MNTVKLRAEVQNENWVMLIARTRPAKTPCSLLSIDRQFPQVDVNDADPMLTDWWSSALVPPSVVYSIRSVPPVCRGRLQGARITKVLNHFRADAHRERETPISKVLRPKSTRFAKILLPSRHSGMRRGITLLPWRR